MSLVCRNAAGAKTANNTVIWSGQARASMACRFIVHTPPDFPAGNLNQYFAAKGNLLYFRTYKANVAGTKTPQFYVRLGATGGGASSTPVFYTDVVNHLAWTYDKDDPSSQALYLNGVKTLLGSPQSTVLVTENQALTVGTTSDSMPIPFWMEEEDLSAWNGYVLTQDDVLAHMAGADPTTIGVGATWRGYYTLRGTPGATPQAGDDALANQIDGSWPLSPYVGPTTAGSSLTYGAAIPFVSQSQFTTPIVGYSGKTVRLSTIVGATGLKTTVASVSSTVKPTIKINGGAPLTLDPLYWTTGHTGIVYKLPTGQSIPKTGVVTMSAGEGSFTTGVGRAAAYVDLPIVNKVDTGLYSDYDPVVAIGENHTGPGNEYWSPEQGPKNWALRIGYDSTASGAPTLRANGTISSNCRLLVNDTRYRNPIDRTGIPTKLGYFALQYDDKDGGSGATAIQLIPGQTGGLVEATAYANLGDANGVGKGKVYQYQIPTFTFTLASDVNSSTTTIPLNSVTNITGLAFDNTSTMWAKIDNEWMDVRVVNSTPKTLTVTRGFFGSTAAAHSAGATVTVQYQLPFANLYVDFNNPNGHPNYDNLVILPPGEFALPDPPGPIVLDRSEATTKGVSKHVLETLANGSGGIRHMDSTIGGFSQCSEPWEARLDTDPFPSGLYKMTRAARPTEARPLTTDEAPYFYVPWHVPGAETYSATLGAAITTTPAAGTEEVITVTDAVSAGVFEGQRLVADGEVMAVKSVDASDPTKLTVVRGQDDTTPVAHAAGPITCRWRIPNTSATQTTVAGYAPVNLHFDRPHGLRAGHWTATPLYSDINPLARVAITLTAAVATTSQTVWSISAADADWFKICSGLHVKVDNEEVIVTTASKDAGTMTVKRAQQGTTAATHSSGAVGAGRSGCFLCQSQDEPTKFAWQDQTGWTQNFYPTSGTSAYMSVQVPITSPALYGVQPLDQTPVIVGGVDETIMGFSTPGRAYSYEHMCRVANLQTAGAAVVVNVPYTATDDLARQIARTVRDNLTPGKFRVLVEYANERWNFAFPFVNADEKASQLQGLASDPDSGLLRARAITDLFIAEFGKTGRSTEIEHMVAWQLGNLGTALGRCRALGVAVDVVSTAPYFRPATSTASNAAFDAADPDMIPEMVLFDLTENTGGTSAAIRNDGLARIAHEQATGTTVGYVFYESGIDSMIPTAWTIAQAAAKNADAMYSPQARCLIEDMPLAYYELLGNHGTLVDIHFNACQAPDGPLPVGSGTYWAIWGTRSHHGQAIGYGDGRDGKADNRLCLAMTGKANSKHPSINQDMNVVSTMAQGQLNYQARRSAYLLAQNPDTGGGGDPSGSFAPTAHRGVFAGLRPFASLIPFAYLDYPVGPRPIVVPSAAVRKPNGQVVPWAAVSKANGSVVPAAAVRKAPPGGGELPS